MHYYTCIICLFILHLHLHYQSRTYQTCLKHDPHQCVRFLRHFRCPRSGQLLFCRRGLDLRLLGLLGSWSSRPLGFLASVLIHHSLQVILMDVIYLDLSEKFSLDNILACGRFQSAFRICQRREPMRIICFCVSSSSGALVRS